MKLGHDVIGKRGAMQTSEKHIFTSQVKRKISQSLRHTISSMYGNFMFTKPTYEIANDCYKNLQREFLFPSERGSLSIEEIRRIIKSAVKTQFKKHGLDIV
ncbi:MAG: hypothetical protein AABY22_11925 [Nanoarchaeota archaeon]